MNLLPILLLSALGCLFILLGRAMCSGLSWGSSAWMFHPDHPMRRVAERFHRFGSRIFGIYFIFFGFMVIFASFSSELPDAAVLIALPLAAFATWLVKPPKPAPPDPLSSNPSVETPRAKRPLFSKYGKWALAGIVVFALFLTIGIQLLFSHSDAYQFALGRAQSSDLVKARLGEPLKTGIFSSGSIETQGSSGYADLSIPLKGSKANGTLYVMGHKKAGRWNFETVELAVDGYADRINLMPETPNPNTPSN